MYGLPLSGAAADLSRGDTHPLARGLRSPPLPARRGTGALPYPGRGGHPSGGCGLSTAPSVGGVAVVRRLVSLQTSSRRPLFICRGFFVSTGAQSSPTLTLVPYRVRRAPPALRPSRRRMWGEREGQSVFRFLVEGGVPRGRWSQEFTEGYRSHVLTSSKR